MKFILLMLFFLVACDPTHQPDISDASINDSSIQAPGINQNLNEKPSIIINQYPISSYPRELKKRIPPRRF